MSNTQPVAGLRKRSKKQQDALISSPEVQLVDKKRQVKIVRRKKRSAKRFRCGECTASVTRLVVAIIAALALIPIMVMVILTYIHSGNTAVSDWCPVLTGDEVVLMEGMGAGGVPDQRAQAYIRMHGNELEIGWDILKQLGNISVVNTFQICGPLSSLEPAVSSTCTSLCGPPSTLVCEGTDPERFSGTIGALEPGSISPETFIRAVRKNPQLYYPRMETANGVLRGPLAVGCSRGD